MWDIRLDMRNKAGFTIAIAFGREMATNRKMGGVEREGERGRGIPYNDHSPRVGVEPANTREHVFKISRVRQVPLACKASTVCIRSVYAVSILSLSLSLLAKLAGFESSIPSDFFDRPCFAFDSILPLPFFIFETERILWKIKINDILELDILYKIVIEINLYPVCLSIPFESKNV